MTGSSPTGRSASLSMADFNERAKRAAANTLTIEKPPERRRNAQRPNRPSPAAEPAGDAKDE